MADRTMIGNTTNPPMTRVNSYAAPGRGMGTASRRTGTQPVYGGYTLNETYEDNQNPEKVAKLYEESVGFENLASDPYVREQAQSAVLSCFKGTLSTMEFMRNKFLQLYRLWRGEVTMASLGGNLHSPTPLKIVETIHPRIMRTIFGSERWFQLYGVGESDDVAAKAQEALCREQFRAMNYRSKTSRFVRGGLIYGSAVQKTYWRQDIEERAYRKARRIPNEENPGTSRIELQPVKRQELVFDGNDCVGISIFDFLAPPTANSIDDAEWCCDRSLWPDYKVKKMIELGHWTGLEALRDDPGTSDGNLTDEFKERKAYAYGVFDGRDAVQSPHIPHYQVVDWWGPLVVSHNGGAYETRICNVVMLQPEGRALIARVTVNPYWHGKKPYQMWRYTDIEGELFGMGPIEMIARLSREKDRKRSLLMSATQLEGNPMWAVSDQSNIPPGQMVAQPGLVLRVPDPKNSIMPLAFPGVSDSALKAENILEAEMREVTGVTAPVIGVNDPMGGASKTATQSNNDLDEANMRLSGAITNFDQEVTCSMLDQMAFNNMQFCNAMKVIRDIGPMGVNFRDRFMIRPEDLIGQFIVQPLSGYRLTTKTTQVQQLINLLDRAPIINQMYGPQAIKMPRLMAFIMEHGFDIRNVDEFVQDDTALLTAMEETEMWYHGNVPPRREDDNDLRHIVVHQEEIATERFQQLQAKDPGTAARAIAHIADHMRKVARLQEKQENIIMLMQQAMAQQGGGGESAGGPAGAAEPGQDPSSPKVRADENEAGGENGEVKSEAMSNAPNEGAQ